MTFQPFDREAERAEYRRHLPHWIQSGCTYFVTFRLIDSLPQSQLREWREERQLWLRARGLQLPADLPKLSTGEQREYHRHFTRRWHEWLDAGYGDCLLREARFAEVVSNALLFFDGQRYALGDFGLMPNHVHLLITPLGGYAPGQLLQSVKRYSAREINKLRGETGSVWMTESFDHLVRSLEQLAHYRRYIRENPEKAGLREGEYRLGCGSDRETDL